MPILSSNSNVITTCNTTACFVWCYAADIAKQLKATENVAIWHLWQCKKLHILAAYFTQDATEVYLPLPFANITMDGFDLPSKWESGYPFARLACVRKGLPEGGLA